jgi:hypothetical protein
MVLYRSYGSARFREDGSERDGGFLSYIGVT